MPCAIARPQRAHVSAAASPCACSGQYGRPSATANAVPSARSHAAQRKCPSCHTRPSAVIFAPATIGSPHCAHTGHRAAQHAGQKYSPSSV